MNEKENSLFAEDIVKMSKQHIMFLTFKFFKDRIQSLTPTTDKNVI